MTGLAGGGIGGVGGFNQASIYSAEAKRRKPVAKSMGIEAPFFGEEGEPVEFGKDWSPNASKFDAEKKRHNRNTAYRVGLAGAAGVAYKGGRLEAKNWTKGQRKAKKLPRVAAKQAARRAEALGHGKKAAALAGGSAVLAGAGALMDHQRKGSWQSYQKRDSVS